MTTEARTTHGHDLVPDGAQCTVGIVMKEDLIFDRSRPGAHAHSLPALDTPAEAADAADLFPPELRRAGGVTDFPEVSEVEVVRHFVRMSQWNYGIDLGLFPLGSCTMKQNPKINEYTARLPGFTRSHPAAPDALAQGNLELMYKLAGFLAEISGMDAVSLQPAAGAQGEFTGVAMIRAYHTARGNPRKKIIVPDSAHGTNPATAAICGYETVTVKTGKDGIVDAADVAAVADEDTAGIMLTNPNTLGIFERNFSAVADVIHRVGGLVYMDGANLNALMGVARPGDIGADVMHINLHKTFTTPHGGGGPGSGPVAFKKILEPYQPRPVVTAKPAGGKTVYALDDDRPLSVGKVRSAHGNFGMFIRAYTYIREMGAKGLSDATRHAVLNANYIKAGLKGYYHLPVDGPNLHEVIFTDKQQAEAGVTTMDIAKRIMDYGFHPFTVYFPLVVHAAIMIEPTETESKQSLDAFITAMRRIAAEAQTTPHVLKSAPHLPFRRRFDEVGAAKRLRLRWKRGEAA